MGQTAEQELEEGPQSKRVLTETLHLIDFLIKYGPTSIVDNFKENVYEFRKLDDYSHKSGSIDQGESSKIVITQSENKPKLSSGF
jgi:hypothetical protein